MSVDVIANQTEANGLENIRHAARRRRRQPREVGAKARALPERAVQIMHQLVEQRIELSEAQLLPCSWKGRAAR